MMQWNVNKKECLLIVTAEQLAISSVVECIPELEFVNVINEGTVDS